MNVDPNDAPKGYYAVQTTRGCTGCAFLLLDDRIDPDICVGVHCLSSTRKDQCSVIFKTTKSRDIRAALQAIVDLGDAAATSIPQSLLDRAREVLKENADTVIGGM